jgi:hypothetical protein
MATVSEQINAKIEEIKSDRDEIINLLNNRGYSIPLTSKFNEIPQYISPSSIGAVNQSVNNGTVNERINARIEEIKSARNEIITLLNDRGYVIPLTSKVSDIAIYLAQYVPTETSYFTFTLLEDDTYSIAAKDATNMPTKVFLPTEYNGKAVTVIGKHAFMDCTDIEYVFIPSTITTIGYGAFAYCYNLGTAWIPHTVTTVDYGVFAYTGTAVYIDIHYPPYPPTGWHEDWDMYLPEGAVHWGVSFRDMFNTTLLTDNTYEVTATETALANEYIYIPDSHEGTDITSIGTSAFAGSSATGVRIGDNITLIGKLAFSGAKMHMIKIPLNVTTIKPLAFSNMSEGTVIYCEAESKPNGWVDNWCDNSVTVVWGDSEIEDTNTYLTDENGNVLTDENGNLLIL